MNLKLGIKYTLTHTYVHASTYADVGFTRLFIPVASKPRVSRGQNRCEKAMMACTFMLLLLPASIVAGSPFAVVNTTRGALRGIKTAKYRMFLGVKYGEAPTGKKR